MDPVINTEEPDQTNKPLEHTIDKEIIKAHGCHECGKFYSDVRSLQRHMKTHRVEESNETHTDQRTSNAGAVPLKCQQCPRQFQRRSHYHYHVKIHHGPREFKCQICEKAFVSRGALTTHGRIHSGEKPYECETCGRRFNVNSNLLAHVPKCTGALPFKCEHCEKAFATRSLYQTHVKVIFFPGYDALLRVLKHTTNYRITIGSPRRICREMWRMWNGVHLFFSFKHQYTI
jgi:KRAB domain-containing zinc finger protein